MSLTDKGADDDSAVVLGPPGTRRSTALVLLVSSHFLLNMDSAIIEVAVPTIKEQLGFSVSSLSWVANSYILTFGGFLLLGGRLGDVLGSRKVFTGGLVAFALASLLGGLASSPEVMILARGAQGLAAAVVSPTALSLLVGLFPDRTAAERAQRHKALGTLGAVAAVGGSTGYFLGGLLTDLVGWEATFLVNVPAALALACFSQRLLPPDAGGTGWARVDFVSAVGASLGMTLLVYALVGSAPSNLLSTWTCGLVLASLTLLLFVVARQNRSADPLFPLRILRVREVRGANLVAALINMAIGPVIFFLSLYIQQVLDFDPLAAGLAILPIVAAITVSSRLTGSLLARFGVRTVMICGLSLFSAGLLWLGAMSGGAYWAEVLGPELVIGFGGGLVFVTFTVCGTSGLEARDAGAASGLLTTSQKVGSALGLALLSTVAATFNRDTELAGLTDGYRAAILAATLPVLAAVAVSGSWLPRRDRR
ncbi:MFS transporter [Streptomyces sp. NPDC000345]|uniref:MFS transporter n=1 Tax=Streptomyces sp. NPDC000345 TaxID=3364537 RepID=UPI0036B09547